MTRPDWPAIESRPATRYGRDDEPWMREPQPRFDWTVWRDGAGILAFIGVVLAACITGLGA